MTDRRLSPNQGIALGVAIGGLMWVAIVLIILWAVG